MKAYIVEVIDLRKCIVPTILTFFLILLILFINSGEAFAQAMDCEGTISSWKLSHPNLNCSCINGQPKCDSSSSGGGGGVGLSQQMAAQIVIQGIMQGLFSVDDAREQERKIEQEMQRIKNEKEREIARKKAWESVEKELMRISSAKPALMSINDEKTACVQGDPTIKRACILNGSPCCPPYVCEGKFPNTYCVFKGSGVADAGPISNCIKGDSLIMRACVLNGTPCCAPYRCKGKFPNTYCVLE